eukprot:Tbor_TRINITY_DN5517_c4_g1::TRINITY_DN5517_c4_g1_i2::g.12577::m.12577
MAVITNHPIRSFPHPHLYSSKIRNVRTHMTATITRALMRESVNFPALVVAVFSSLTRNKGLSLPPPYRGVRLCTAHTTAHIVIETGTNSITVSLEYVLATKSTGLSSGIGAIDVCILELYNKVQKL